MWRSAIILLMLGGVAAAAPPSKGEAVTALQKSVKGLKSVSQIFADLGDRRFPVLFVTRGRDCIERVIDKQQEQSCSATTLPHAGVLKRDEKGQLQLESELTLPTTAAPWDMIEELKWGIANVKDYDGDGKPELLVIYGYNGPMFWAVGDIYYRELCLLNLDKLAPALHVTLDEKPQATVFSDISTKFKFGTGEVLFTQRSGDYDDSKRERVYRESTLSFRWDAAKDLYLEVNPPKK
jgi:hypothetical protein